MNEPIVIVTLIMGIVELLLTIALFWVGGKARRIDSLEAEVTASARKIIDAKFDLLAVDFKAVTNELRYLVETMQKRLDRGDKQFERQAEDQHEMEIGAVSDAAKLREFVIEKYATKGEMDSLRDSLRKVETRVAVFEEHVKGAGR